MKNYILLFAFISFCSSLNSQSIKLTPALKTFETKDNYDRIIAIDGGYLVIEAKGEKPLFPHNAKLSFLFKKYDSNLNLIKESVFAGGEKAYGQSLYKLMRINNKVWFFYFKAIDGRLGNIMAVEVNHSTLETNQPKLISNVEGEGFNLQLYKLGFNSVNLQVSSSPNMTKNIFLLQFEEQNLLSVTDENLNVLWTNKKLPGYVHATAIDNRGKVYVGFKSLKGSQSANTQFAILSKEQIFYKEALSNRADYYNFLISKDGNTLHIAGAYSENSSRLTGVFRTDFNLIDATIISTQKHPFPNHLIELLEKEKWASSSKEAGINHPFIPKLYELEDRSIVLVSRFEAIDASKSFTWSGPILLTYLTAKDPVFIRVPRTFAHSGKWEPVDDYYIYPSKGKLVLFYNDDPQNFQENLMDPHLSKRSPLNVRGENNGVLMYCIVERDGTFKRGKVIVNKKGDFAGVTAYAAVIGSSIKVILKPLKFKGDEVFADIEINDLRP